MSVRALAKRLFEPLWVKIAIPFAASILLFSLAIFGVHLPSIYNTLLDEKKAALENLVQVAVGMIQYYHELEQRGALSREEAQRRALEALGSIRFGTSQKDYFWVNDLEPRMVLHPYVPALNGQDLSEYKDVTGKRLFVEAVRQSEETGSAFITYSWQWQDDSNLVVAKVSYVKRFAPWGWIVGSGVYLKDITALAKAQAEQLLYSSIAVLAAVAALSFFPIWQGVFAARKIRDREATLQGIFDQTREFMGVLDLDGRVRQINRTALEFAGITQADVRDKLFWETAWWQGQAEWQATVKEAVVKARDGERTEFESQHVSHDGREVCVDVTIQPIRGANGATLCIFADGVDVTERKRTQKELEDRVAQRTHALAESLASLKRAQNQLVQSEKMAALGGLVAGVAHEINTPLGLGVTNASFLEEQVRGIRQSYESGKFTKGEFEVFLARADEAVRSMLLNLRRGAEIIRSFKRVAVDQETEEARTIVLHDYIDEVLVSLRPRYKHTGHSVEVLCPDGISLNTYPGVLMQVLANLILNSLIHGFENKAAGVIRIEAEQRADHVVLTYSDDGRGMNAEEQAKVYDPFFTTKQGHGGTGLGMHIVFNLVTQKLGGTIDLKTAPGEGVCFTLVLPVRLPGRAA